MRGLLAAGPAELLKLYLKFLLFAPREVVILVLARGAAEYDRNSISHS